MAQVDQYRGSEPCSLARALEVVGERWTFFLLREALAGSTRFSEFRTALGIASDVLATRLATLVDGGVMERRAYREQGQRARDSYHLTAAGRELSLVVAALQQWGERYAPSTTPCTIVHRGPGGAPVSVAFLDSSRAPLSCTDVSVERLPTA